MERLSLEEKNIIKDIRSIFKDKIENLEIFLNMKKMKKKTLY